MVVVRGDRNEQRNESLIRWCRCRWLAHLVALSNSARNSAADFAGADGNGAVGSVAAVDVVGVDVVDADGTDADGTGDDGTGDDGTGTAFDRIASRSQSMYSPSRRFHCLLLISTQNAVADVHANGPPARCSKNFSTSRRSGATNLGTDGTDADGVKVDVTESRGSAALDRADAKMSNRLGDRLILSLAI
ncbi:MAG: hypothetical protein ACK57G_10085 [Planctomycetota bacterium]